MKVAILQFAPKLGQFEQNVAKADSILHAAGVVPGDHSPDLIVLPEMAFSGYNFLSKEAIEPFLEDGTSGPSVLWAKNLAAGLGCHICIGFPEKCAEGRGNFNSLVIVDSSGKVVMHYRKSHLYYTDETWATEGSGFIIDDLDFSRQVVPGICMDINPYKFLAPYDKYEFATFCQEQGARFIVLSTAWTAQMPERLLADYMTPDHDTLIYWFNRMKPLLSVDGEETVTVVFANRCGTEPGTPGHFLAINVKGDVAYAGTSCVMQFSKDGASILNVMGRGEEGLLEVDTSAPPRYRIMKSAPEAAP